MACRLVDPTPPDRGDNPSDLYARDLLPRVGHVGFDGSPHVTDDDLDQYAADQQYAARLAQGDVV